MALLSLNRFSHIIQFIYRFSVRFVRCCLPGDSVESSPLFFLFVKNRVLSDLLIFLVFVATFIFESVIGLNHSWKCFKVIIKLNLKTQYVKSCKMKSRCKSSLNINIAFYLKLNSIYMALTSFCT